MDGGYVALLDVLGFSALVGGDQTGQKIRRYLDCLERVTHQGEVKYVVFSDSIVLTVSGESPESFIAVAGACSRLQGELLTEGIALRGAIAFGNFFRSSVAESVFVAGRAVIDAYQFEQAQNWVGVMVAPSAVQQVGDLDSRCSLKSFIIPESFRDVEYRISWPAFIQPCHQIPFHSATPLERSDFDGFAVVPTSGVLNPTALRDSIKAAIDRLKWLRSIAPSPNAQRKYSGTVNWLDEIQRLWHGVAFLKTQAPETTLDA